MLTKPPINFSVVARDGAARAGILNTRRGIIETPVFMPVGSAGTVKGIRFEELESKDLDARIILGNTYHLWLRPGAETIRACGGLHRFIGWDRPLLTDSGGFQVWSLGALRKINEEGTEFRSHVDGSLRFLSREVSMEVQAALGSEIVMVFDECAPGKATHDEARASLELTARWAKRSREKFDQLQREAPDMASLRLATENSAAPIRNPKSEIRNPKFSAPSALPEDLSGGQALFGVIQGAAHRDLRR